MAISKERLETLLQVAFPEATISLKDTVGDGDHYEVTIISPLFKDKSRIEQHKMVYVALGDMLKNTLHALQIKTKAS